MLRDKHEGCVLKLVPGDAEHRNAKERKDQTEMGSWQTRVVYQPFLSCLLPCAFLSAHHILEHSTALDTLTMTLYWKH